MLIPGHLAEHHPLSNYWGRGFQPKKSALISMNHDQLQQLEAGSEIDAFTWKWHFIEYLTKLLMSKTHGPRAGPLHHDLAT